MPFCVVAKLCVAAVLHNAHLQRVTGLKQSSLQRLQSTSTFFCAGPQSQQGSWALT